MQRCVILLLLMGSAHCTFSGSHSHYFYTTLTYNSSFESSFYSSMRMIDDVPLFWYDSDNGVVERQVPWFKGVNTSLWGVSRNELRFHGVMQAILNETLNYINNTEGYHVLQNLDGCAVNTDGTIGYIKEYQYNGQPFIYFDWETRKWKSELPEFEGFKEDVFGNYTMTEEEK
ncbi:unnamed protein product [Ranitomeya imitator]|uniref:MHC class I-like antigen recognition-like domain-containing protein n=1 Tax=Ranitomeya imitator TaxID=111125 RepID=A0ABN9MGG1_9NEOB|nr:unnamed protein product [Ranitomeya imitator]